MSIEDRSRRVLAALMVAMPLAAFAQYSQSGHVVANGGTSIASGGGYTLQGTIAEPVAGTASAGALTLDGGFWQPARTPPADALVSNGVEG